MWPHAIAVACLAAVCGCHPDPDAASDSESLGLGSDDGPVETGSTGDGMPQDACAHACEDLATETGIAACHSCRCKVAFDDWLPAIDELQCGSAEKILTYHADLSSPEIVLEPVGPSATHCANPSLLTGSCRPGSKLGRLRHGDVAFYWVCRDPYLDLDGSVIYEDMATIGHNLRTGATCFWDDVDDSTHDDDVPSFDLTDATDEERSRFAVRFNFTDGSGCVACHDHDPFLYTPYLQSTGWQSVALEKGPYSLVDLDGTLRATGTKHLVSAEAQPCTACHRLGSENTCTSFAPDALAVSKADSYESEVLDAMAADSPHWKLAYWMPSTTLPLPDFTAWLSTFDDAREHILRCCQAPGQNVDECEWEPVPRE